MRAALPKCASSHVNLLNFIASRSWFTTHCPRHYTTGTRELVQTVHVSCSRHRSSASTKARATADKPSLLDVASIPKYEPSFHAAQVKKCALDDDVLGVWVAYKRIRDRNPRLVLGPEHLGTMSFMIMRQFASIKSTKNRSEQEMYAMEELAFACAGAGYVEGLRQMLLWHLARGDTEKVIDAYERFERTVLILDESGLERGSDLPEVTATDSDLGEDENVSQTRLENPDISRLDVANIMAITVAAYALQSRFDDALQFMLRQQSHRVTGDQLKDLWDGLKACGATENELQSLIAKAKIYADIGSMARLVQMPEVFKVHIRNLLKEKGWYSRLEKVRQTLKDGFTGELQWAVVEGTTRPPKNSVVVSERIFAYLVHAYMSMHREEEAQQIWADVITLGKTPGVCMWNALLEAYRDSQQLEKLVYTWDMMREEGIPYDARSYGAKLSCLAQVGSSGPYWLRLFDEFKKTNASYEDSLFVYNTVLHGLLAKKDVKSAVGLLMEMRKTGPRPDTVSYNTFIGYYARRGDLRGIGQVVRQLTKSGVEPDVFTFTTILTAMLKARVPNGAERVLALMEDMGVKQNVATYSAIIDSQVREGTELGIKAAWDVLRQMERMKDVKPNIITYTSFLAGVHRSQELNKELIASITSEIAQMMKKRGMRLKLGTYHILFKACLENPNPEALEFFIDYYNMMRKSEIACRHDTWYIILDGLSRRNEWKLASEMKNQMLESGFQPIWGVMQKMKLIQSREGSYA